MVTSAFLCIVCALIGGITFNPWLRKKYSSIPGWNNPINTGDASATFPISLTHDVNTLRCHSHNDYWQRVPLFQALHYGCISVEADVWLTSLKEGGETDLYVGHTITSLEQRRTLRSLYINPLLRILDTMNHNNTAADPKGVFESAPTQTLVLLVDLKNGPDLTFDAVSAQLEPLRSKGYLTYHNGTDLVPGPLSIVATGTKLPPYSSILTQPSAHRDILSDAPLGDLKEVESTAVHENDSDSIVNDFQDYDTTNSLYASASLRKVLRHPFPFLFPGGPTPWQREQIRSATQAAHARGLKVRWWDTPDWPRSRRARVWKILMEEGADVLNVDDLKAARDWDEWP